MDCREFQHSIDDYLTGSVAENSREEMKAHLAACPACTRLVAAQGIVLESLSSTERLKAPSGLAERILLAAAGEDSSAGLSRWGIILDIAAACAVIFGFIMLAARWAPRPNLQVGELSGRLSEGLAVVGDPVFHALGRFSGASLTEQFGLVFHTFSGLFLQPVPIPYTPLIIPLYLPVLSLVAALSLWSYLSPGKILLSA